MNTRCRAKAAGPPSGVFVVVVTLQQQCQVAPPIRRLVNVHAGHNERVCVHVRVLFCILIALLVSLSHCPNVIWTSPYLARSVEREMSRWMHSVSRDPA